MFNVVKRWLYGLAEYIISSGGLTIALGHCLTVGDMGGGGWSRQLVRRKTSHLLTHTLRDLPALTVRIEQGLECVDQGVYTDGKGL